MNGDADIMQLSGSVNIFKYDQQYNGTFELQMSRYIVDQTLLKF